MKWNIWIIQVTNNIGNDYIRQCNRNKTYILLLKNFLLSIKQRPTYSSLCGDVQSYRISSKYFDMPKPWNFDWRTFERLYIILYLLVCFVVLFFLTFLFQFPEKLKSYIKRKEEWKKHINHITSSTIESEMTWMEFIHLKVCDLALKG